MCSAHAPCVPRHPGRGREGCGGYAGASSAAPGTGTEPVPGGLARPPRGLLAKPAETLSGPQGPPSRRPRYGDFCPGPIFGFPPLRCRRGGSPRGTWPANAFPPLLALSALAVSPGLPDVGSSNTRTYLPGAGRCYAGCWYRRPAASCDGRIISCRARGGDWRRQRSFQQSAIVLNGGAAPRFRRLLAGAGPFSAP